MLSSYTSSRPVIKTKQTSRESKTAECTSSFPSLIRIQFSFYDTNLSTFQRVPVGVYIPGSLQYVCISEAITLPVSILYTASHLVSLFILYHILIQSCESTSFQYPNRYFSFHNLKHMYDNIFGLKCYK